MKFIYNGIEYDTTKYIASFIDENSGDVIPDKKVLDKKVRLLWFRSAFPTAVITSTVKNIPATDATGDCGAIARVKIEEDGLVIGSNYALRYANKESGFSYYVEAAINAAVDRTLCDLGFICNEEIAECFPSSPDAPLKPTVPVQPPMKATQAQTAIADIMDMVDGENNIESESAPCYDINTPVAEILKVMDIDSARSAIFPSGKHKGKTVGQVYEETKDSKKHSATLEWFTTKYNGKDNILRAACTLVNK